METPPATRRVPIRALLPSMVTLAALCIGLTAVRYGIEGRFDRAVYAIVFAAVLDGVDGRLARALKSTSRFGAELDSLADFVNFMIVPAMLLYVWSLNALGNIGWLAALLFAICGALRLARFNTAIDTEKEKWENAYFTGVPAPSGACLALLPLTLSFLGVPTEDWPWAVLAYTLLIGLLMVSRIPTFSMKNVGRIEREKALFLLLGMVAFIGLLASATWTVLTACAVLYFILIPVAGARYRRDKRRHSKVG